MANIEIIKAEIKRRKAQFMSQADSFHFLGKIKERDQRAEVASIMDSLLRFIDALEETDKLCSGNTDYLEKEYPEKYTELQKKLMEIAKPRSEEAIKKAEDSEGKRSTLEEAAKRYADSIAQNSDRKIFCREDFIAGAEWADKTIIDKACKFINQLCDGFSIKDNIMGMSYSKEELLKDFRKAMQNG